jgi:hypothetical protein
MFGGLAVFGMMGLLVGPLIASLFMAMVRIYRRDFLGIGRAEHLAATAAAAAAAAADSSPSHESEPTPVPVGAEHHLGTPATMNA